MEWLRDKMTEIWARARAVLSATRPAATTPSPKEAIDAVDLENDPFFRLPAISDWNACIGKQGNELNYLDGYIEAALEAVDAVIQQKKFDKRDTVVLPVLYNGRHAVELLLKFVADRLFAVGAISHVPPRNHDIGEYWRVLVEANVGDETLRNQIERLGKFVRSLTRVDEDGQELRYHVNRDKEKSLATFSLVNLEVIREGLTELQDLLREMTYRTLDFIDERATGTFTTRLSRRDLFTVAGILPSLDRWKSDDFKRAKEDIKKRFNLGNRQFSFAIAAIKKSRELSALLGRETPLTHLSDDDVLWVVDQWSRAHPARKGDEPGIDYFGSGRVEKMQEGLRVVREAVDAVTKHLSADEISELETLFYLGSDNLPTERYDRELKERKRAHAIESDPRQAVSHILEKTNFLMCLTQALRRLGCTSLVARLPKRGARD